MALAFRHKLLEIWGLLGVGCQGFRHLDLERSTNVYFAKEICQARLWSDLSPVGQGLPGRHISGYSPSLNRSEPVLTCYQVWL